MRLSDEEIIRVLLIASQVATGYHIRGFFSTLRKGIRNFFEDAISTQWITLRW